MTPILGIMASQISGHLTVYTDIAIGSASSPYIQVYPWTTGTGFGTKYTNPATLPTNAPFDAVGFNPANTVLATGHDTSPYVTTYPWTAGTGFGTKYANPSTLPTNLTRNLDWTSSGADLFLASGFDLAGNAYAWSNGFGSRYTSAPTNVGNYNVGVTVKGTSQIVNIGNQNSAYGFPWTPGTGYGTAYSSPSFPLLQLDNLGHGSFSPDGAVIDLGNIRRLYTAVYAWSGSGWGSKYSEPSNVSSSDYTTPTASWNRAGSVLIHTGNQTPTVNAYAWTNASGFGTRFGQPATAFTGTYQTSLAFNKLDTDVISGGIDGVAVNAYAWTNASGFGTKYSQPATATGGDSYWTAFTN